MLELPRGGVHFGELEQVVERPRALPDVARRDAREGGDQEPAKAILPQALEDGLERRRLPRAGGAEEDCAEIRRLRAIAGRAPPPVPPARPPAPPRFYIYKLPIDRPCGC